MSGRSNTLTRPCAAGVAAKFANVRDPPGTVLEARPPNARKPGCHEHRSVPPSARVDQWRRTARRVNQLTRLGGDLSLGSIRTAAATER